MCQHFITRQNLRALLGIFCLIFASAGLAANKSASPRLLLISLDGLRPDYISQAADYKLKVPYLRSLVDSGASATGVRGVLPTSTYPSHTSLITGAFPAQHGIVANHPFDPKFASPGSWFWYAEDIRVPTLWQAASEAGRVTASISWPVTVGAKDIQFNIPEFNGTRTDEDLKMVRALASLKLMEELEKKAGKFSTDVNKAVARDWGRTRYAVELLREKQVDFLTVHLAASDHLQHESGPFTPAALAAIAEIDKMAEAMGKALLAEDPNGIICIVSDHGFAPVSAVFKLNLAFVQAGLITLKSEGESLEKAGVKNWSAMPWPSGGSAGIVLKDPKDSAVRAKVKALLETLAADPVNGIAGILDQTTIRKLGGNSDIEFWVDMKPGFSVSSSLKAPLVSAVSARGTHSYSPTHPEMNSTFIIAGYGISRGQNLGEIDMRSIAPTLAKAMKVSFPSAALPPLSIFEKAGK